jgi:peptidyl-prolyl cis-trans isomerase B (cyclophilin B)
MLCFSAAQEAIASESRVILQTNHGDITIALYPEAAPKTVENFLRYVREGFYDGTIFHRVIKGFMIQGGGLIENMERKPTHEPIPNEADNRLANEKGTLAMARTQDPDSASCQFFINAANNDFLNHTSKTMDGWGYCVFGKVVEGMDVVDKIEGVKTTNRAGHQDVPADAVFIEKATIVSEV